MAKTRWPFPAYFLIVDDDRAIVARQKGRTIQIFNFEMPPHWIEFVCNYGRSRRLTIYPLPPLIFEWVIFKVVKDDLGARSVADKIERFLSTLDD